MNSWKLSANHCKLQRRTDYNAVEKQKYVLSQMSCTIVFRKNTINHVIGVLVSENYGTRERERWIFASDQYMDPIVF